MEEQVPVAAAQGQPIDLARAAGSGDQPSGNGSEGRSADGKFIKGWKGGPGNPHARRVSQLRAMLLEAVSDEDVRDIAKKLVDQARDGNLAAVKELLDRTIGKPAQTELLERVEALEALVHDLSKEAPK